MIGLQRPPKPPSNPFGGFCFRCPVSGPCLWDTKRLGTTVPNHNDTGVNTLNENDRKAYWRSNLRLMAILLVIWALVSVVASALIVDSLNEASFLNVPFGFWMGQQGSIITFVILIAVYVWRMEKLDEQYGIDEESSAPGGNA